MRGSLKLLGDWQAVGANGQEVDITSKRERELLTLLAVHQGKRVSREMLATRIWDRDTFQARKSLNTTLWRLRSAINDSGNDTDDWLQTGGDYMRLRRTRGPHVDFIEFKEFKIDLVQPVVELEELNHTIALYKGDLAPGLEADWLHDERRQLQDRYQKLLSQAIDLLIEARMFDLAEEYASRLIEEDPYEERAWRAIIAVQVETGNRPQAIQTYQELEALLREELGVSPSEETLALYRVCRGADPVVVPHGSTRTEAVYGRIVRLQSELNRVVDQLAALAEEIKDL